MATVPSPAGHPPYHGADHTSAWFATQYIHNHLPGIDSHDLVKLTASVGQETKGNYNYQSIVNAVRMYQHDQSFPQFQATTGPNWLARIHQITQAAKRHGHKDWVTGFSLSTKDVPGTGGPSNVQKAAIGTSHGISDVGNALGSAAGGLGGLISSPILILVILVVVVIVIKK